MTRLESLIELRGKVKLGKVAADDFRRARLCKTQTVINCMSAFEGSLDAAKALHQAVLPDLGWALAKAVDEEKTCAAWVGTTSEEPCALSDNPARAWLLAILEELIAQEQQP